MTCQILSCFWTSPSKSLSVGGVRVNTHILSPHAPALALCPLLGLGQKARSSRLTLLSILQKGALLYPPNHSTHQPVTCPSRHLHCLVDSFIPPPPSNYTRHSLQAPSVSFITSYSLSPKTTPSRCSINLLN